MDAFISKCKRISKAEGFPDMEICFSPAGNMAWIKGNKIPYNKIELQSGSMMPPTDDGYDYSDYPLAMFLHELAHFKYNKESGISGHDGRYADIFTFLVAKYMIDGGY